MIRFTAVLMFLVCFVIGGRAQTEKERNKAELETVVKTFMESLRKKDGEKFYSLFHEGPVVWVGIYKETSQRRRLQKDSQIKSDYFTGDYEGFFKFISGKGFYEETFSNVVIVEDGYVASVTFDYSFWANGKKENWGKESWGLIRANGRWKITSVIFSLEYEDVQKEPTSQRRLKK